VKIGIIARTVPPLDRGGIQTHVFELSKALANKGIEVHLFIKGGQLKIPDINIHEIRPIPLPRLTLGEYVSFSLLSAGMVKAVGLDLVHGHSMYSFGYAMTRKKGLPYVLTAHGTQKNELKHTLKTRPTPNHVITDFGSMLMERYSAKKADAVVVVSQENKRDIMAQYGIPQNKVRVIHNGINPDRFKASELDGNRIIYVGRLHERKGVDRLLMSFKKVLDEMKAELVIVGSGEMEGHLKELARKLDIEESVRFCGFVDDEDIPGLYASSSLFVMPSYYEGFGIVLLEAMASGLPVVATATGGAPELVENEKNGFLATHENMHKSIISLLQDRALMRNCGSNNRKKAIGNFSWDAIAERTIEVYSELLTS
jgi:glycosyltransferase involved in cell wall biosynthesis